MEDKTPIFIEQNLFTKIKLLSDYDFEIAGWLLGKITNGIIHLDDILIPIQEANSGNVDIDTEGIVDILKNHKEKVKDIIGHFHTHMGSAFFSQGDEVNHEKLRQGKDFFLFLVMAKSSGATNGDYQYDAKIVINKPIRYEVPVRLQLVCENFEEIKKEIEKEVNIKVKKKSYAKESENLGMTVIKSTYVERDGQLIKEEKPEPDWVKKFALKYEKEDKSVDKSSPWCVKFQELYEYEALTLKDYMANSPQYKYLGYMIQPVGESAGIRIYDYYVDCKHKKTCKKFKKDIENELKFGEAEGSDSSYRFDWN